MLWNERGSRIDSACSVSERRKAVSITSFPHLLSGSSFFPSLEKQQGFFTLLVTWEEVSLSFSSYWNSTQKLTPTPICLQESRTATFQGEVQDCYSAICSSSTDKSIVSFPQSPFHALWIFQVFLCNWSLPLTHRPPWLLLTLIHHVWNYISVRSQQLRLYNAVFNFSLLQLWLFSYRKLTMKLLVLIKYLISKRLP